MVEIDIKALLDEMAVQRGMLGDRAAEFALIVAQQKKRIADLEQENTQLREKEKPDVK